MVNGFTNSLHCNTVALVGILKKSDFKSVTEAGQVTSEVKDNQVAAQIDVKNAPTSQNMVQAAEFPADNTHQDKSSFIADVMVSTEVKSKLEGPADGAKHPPDQNYLSTMTNQMPAEQAPATIDQIPRVSTSQPPISTDQRPPVMVDQAPTLGADQAPPASVQVTVDQTPTVTPTVSVDQPPTVTVDQPPTVTVNQASTVIVNQEHTVTGSQDLVTADQAPPFVSNQVPQPQNTGDNIPPVTDNQVLLVTGKPIVLSAEQTPPVTADQTDIDQKAASPVNIVQDQVTVSPAPENQASEIATVTADQAKPNQASEVTVNQDQVLPVMNNQVPPFTDQKPSGTVFQLEQTSSVSTTVDQVPPSVTAHQAPSILSTSQKLLDQELDTTVKAAVHTAPLTDVKQTSKNSQPLVEKSAQSKSGKMKKMSAKEGITRLHKLVPVTVY